VKAADVIRMTGRIAAGGMLGMGNAVIKDCVSSGSVYSMSVLSLSSEDDMPQYAGVTMRIETLTTSAAGGIAGDLRYSEIRNTSNDADVHALSYVRISVDNSTDMMYEPAAQVWCTVMSGGMLGAGDADVTDACNYGTISSSSELSYIGCFRTGSDGYMSTIYAGGCTGDRRGTNAVNFFNAGAIGTYDTHPERNFETRLVPIIPEPHPFVGGYAENSYYLDPDGYAGGPYGGGMRPLKEHAVTYTNSFEGWDFGRIWMMTERGPGIWMRYDVRIIDTSGLYDGNEKYHTDREYSFDDNGNMITFTDLTGFSVTLAEGFENSGITIYMIDNGWTRILEKDGSDNYIIPGISFLDVSEGITLYIAGLESAPPERVMTIVAVLMLILVVSVAVVTFVNVITVNITIAECAETERHRKEDNERAG
jgi:hypothetical protein